MSDFRQTLLTGASWMVAVRVLDRALGLVSTIILARLLVPADFGLVAMATSVLFLLEMLSTFSFDVALIREASPDRSTYDTAWTLNVLLGLILGVGLVLLAYPAAGFYSDPRVAPVMFALAAAPALQGLENIGVVAFRKELNFRAEFMWLTGKRLVTLVTVLPLAFLLRSYWALVAGIVIGRGAGMLLSYLAHPYRPKPSLAARHVLLRFSRWVLTVNILGFFLHRSTDLVIGRTLGSAALGTYSLAAEVASLPTTELVAPINRAAYPAFAKIADDRPQFKREYLAMIGVIALIVIPVAVCSAAISAELVVLLLGGNWLPAVPLVKALALLGAVQFPYTNAYAVFLAVGRPDYQVRVHCLHVPVLVALLIFLTARYGIEGAAWAIVSTGVVVVPVSLYFVFRELGVRVREFAGVVWRPVLAAAAMYALMAATRSESVPVGIPSAALHLVTLVAVGGVVYVLGVLSLWWCVGAPASAERRLLTHGWDLLRVRVRPDEP
jgi:O-antigen/teichoic acid export membrane protein